VPARDKVLARELACVIDFRGEYPALYAPAVGNHEGDRELACIVGKFRIQTEIAVYAIYIHAFRGMFNDFCVCFFKW
jgi:hypothetical protein